MNEAIRALEPKALWNHFADLNAVPRPSKKEERVIQFIKEFGEKLGLPTQVDQAGNVIIKKPGTKGKEKETPVALQSHLDMVHQKNNDTQFNFDTDGIKMKVEGDWVKADGTTLGADNGIGVASIMALLESKDIPHPPLEALFTIDEETGMTGAFELKGGLLDAHILLNLDTEEDNELTIGCAGGVDVTATGTYAGEAAPKGIKGYRLKIEGLTGGHSGTEIHIGRGNANKLMNRILLENEGHGIRVSTIEGGSLRNAIPRESVASIGVPTDKVDAFTKDFEKLRDTLKSEYGTTDPELKIGMAPADLNGKVMATADQGRFLRAVQACPGGIYRLSPDVEDLVQTSNNVARIELKDGNWTVMCLTRGSVDSEKMDEANSIKAVFELIDAKVEFTGAYPGWTPRPDAKIVKLMADIYRERFKSEPHVLACHAGLECGILGTNYPKMEMISFGPTIRGPHSPDERVQISSVQKYWGFLLETLERI
ncbi:MAG: aminoacyl-histidine dipeptidase [Flavobacteriales bacterium]|jgi:dipeptidase D|nr:aminoacyl-histidine dipeptidase [Flavobacteriales bacterium]MBK6894045.1 aminoacyl-histidine dipeptidase [Flavobacteriales bacterium]MBK7247989.1 aminoacyl-histidine dipeptidase [Flavobacteriales bacterium]MBK9598347.1 aminoacyl-histidine dipeptidase [Flavobacteriales bacterium]QQS73257.1 MAG: aminoacyl-histidine dipeptidase [Flavobacteriales bacterium]